MTWISAFDAAVLNAVASVRHPVVTGLMRNVTPLGGTFVATALVLVAAALLARRGRVDLAEAVVALVGGGALVSTTLKVLVDRARPLADAALIPLPATRSFPSGHAMASLCIAIAVVFLAAELGVRGRRRAWLVAAVSLYAVAVAVSRVYLGVHWPSDIVGSWVLGGVWCSAVLAVYRALHPDKLPPGATTAKHAP